MPVYAYKGVNGDGRNTRGHLDAESLRSARTRLRSDGIYLTEIQEGQADKADSSEGERSRLRLPSFQRVSSLDLALITRQAATLLSAGIPLVQSLRALTEQTENTRLKTVFGQVRERVNEGSSFADALAASDVFPDLYVSMVRAGEAGGALETVLERLAVYLESQVRLRNKVGSILIYPMVMFGFAMVVVAALVTVVLPQITQLLESLNQELPIYTRVIIAGSEFTRSWWWAMSIASVAAFLGLRAATRTGRGRVAYDRFMLRLPVVGRLVRLVSISRFTRTLSTLLAGGLPITRALHTAGEVSANSVIAETVEAARLSITEGASIAQPLRDSG